MAGIFSIPLALGVVALVLGFPRSPQGARPESGESVSRGGRAEDPVDRASRLIWTDVTDEAGISFVHEAGARGEMLNPETFGTGCGWLDYDGDGKTDLLYVNANLLRGDPDPAAVSALYRNLGDGRFEDVTEKAGLAMPFYGMGFVSADVDGDADQDLLLYGLHRSIFFLNQGNGTFREATELAGLTSLSGWVCAATFLDYDRDGKLDLFVGNYVAWTPESEKDVDCSFGTPRKKYCPVAVFSTTHPQLFRGGGDGTFIETTETAGFSKLKGKNLGVAVEDYDRDGFPDIFVANDSVPNFLLHNRGDGTFEDRGLESGLATDADGAALAGMGIDTAWAPDGGPLFVAIGNFSGEPATLHVQEEIHYFIERSLSTGVGKATLDRVTFGLLLLDADLDGNLDLFLANGHVFDVQDITGVSYRQKPQLFLGRDWRTYVEFLPADPASFLNQAIVGRSAACADYDMDGDLDLAVTVNQGKGLLVRNDLAGPKRWVRLELRGTKSNRDAIGAEATLRVSGPRGSRVVRRTLKAVSSYLSQSERRLHFGLGDEPSRTDVEVLWPSGLRERFDDVAQGREVLLVEGAGVPGGFSTTVAAAGSTGTRTEAATGPASAAESSGAYGAAGGTAEEPGTAVPPVAGGTSRNPIVARRRAMDLFHMGRFAEASSGFEAAIRLDPLDFVSHRTALASLWRSGKRGEVAGKVAEIIRVFPDPNFLVSHFAIVLRESGYPELSEAVFAEVSKIDPRRVDVWISLGNLAFDRKDYDRAFVCYAKALQLKPDSIEGLANTGKIHTIRKDFDRAIPYLEKALSLKPDYATALSTLGGVYIELKDFPRAEEILTRALGYPSSDDTKLTIHGNLGILYFKLRQRDKAIRCFQKVLELDPSDAQATAALERLRE